MVLDVCIHSMIVHTDGVGIARVPWRDMTDQGLVLGVTYGNIPTIIRAFILRAGAILLATVLAIP